MIAPHCRTALRTLRHALCALPSALYALLPALCASAATPDQIEFFESRIRPILAQECYECHSTATKQRGGLLLDSRPGWQAGGDTGPAIVPGNPDASLLLQSIRHAHADLAMPKNGAKLDDAILANFARWIADGAPDPRDAPPSANQTAQDQAWPAVLERRKQGWAFQPLKKPDVPTGNLTEAIDHLINQKLKEHNLTPAPKAPPHVLQRRLHYTLTGLPPAVEKSAIRNPQSAIDSLLASPHFGEKWARHWMDWLRYAETHGSEGDTPIPHAWRYRDYLIRALNAGIPYPQILREHIAGDLLPEPRLNPELRLNESALATGHYRMVLHGFTPTDPTDELATFTDNQIDVISKAFLGVTVSCARCHNHKFDALSQTDFYALYGIFASCKPALIDVSADPARPRIQQQLQTLKTQIQAALAQDWLAAPPSPISDLPSPKDWQNARQTYQKKRAAEQAFLTQPSPLHWSAHSSFDIRHSTFWHTSASTPETHPHPPGQFTLHPKGPQALRAILPAGIHSHLLSDKDRAVLISSRFQSEGGTVFARVAGEGKARARFSVQNYPRKGTVYPKTDLTDPAPKWVRWNLDYFTGDTVHIELATEADQPVETKDTERSWFGITDLIYLPEATTDTKPPSPPGPPPLAALLPQDIPAPENAAAFASLHQQATQAAITRWTQNKASDTDAAFLDHLLQSGQLPNALDQLPTVAPLIRKYRELEQQLAAPVRAPGILEADAFDQPLYVRGDHKNPAEPVARRFLEAIDPIPYRPANSGRLQLAESMLHPDNPLTWRVIVNRVWHHLFGQGLVPSPDNLGRLGDPPTHPELLDLLAIHFRDSGGSIKDLIRAIVMTDTFQRSSLDQSAIPNPQSAIYLAHFPIRRLEAEAIRDSILALSGQLDTQLYGQPVPGDQPRRSVYVRVIRNDLDPFLNTFDAPVPSTTRGRRDATNVPAQSLTLLNDPTVLQWAQDWAARTLKNSNLTTDEARVTHLFQQALNRAPTENELAQSLAYLRQVRAQAEADHQKQNQLRQEIAGLQNQLDTLLTTARRQFEPSQQTNAAPPPDAPRPLADWTFTSAPEDQEGKLPLTLHGSARVENNALVLDGNASYAATPPLPVTLTAKTLEAWVTLDTLDQRGGGVLTVQDLQGQVFDSLVFGEKTPAHWLAGSDHFSRSEPFEGDAETEASQRPVHIAITYAADGVVTAYRDGQPYGRAYRKAPLATFAAGQSQILLGCRHGAPTGNRLLKGRIHRARLYARALTPAEVHASSLLEPRPLTEADLLTALPPAKQQRIKTLRAQLQTLQTQLPTTPPPDPHTQANAALTQSLVNLKEFIYLR